MRLDNLLIYGSVLDFIETLSDEDAGRLIKGINKWRNGGEPKFDNPILQGYWLGTKPNFENLSNRYNTSVENGKKGGRPKGSTKNKPKETPKEEKVIDDKPNETQPNLKVIDDKPKEEPKIPLTAEDIIINLMKLEKGKHPNKKFSRGILQVLIPKLEDKELSEVEINEILIGHKGDDQETINFINEILNDKENK